MKAIFLITRREYLSRVRKKSFIIMTLLSPILVVVFYGFIIYFTIHNDIADSLKKIAVIDPTHLVSDKLENPKNIQFVPIENQSANSDELLKDGNLYGVMVINGFRADSSLDITLISREQPSLNLSATLEEQVKNIVKFKRLSQMGIEQTLVEKINNTDVHLKTEKLTDQGIERGNSGATTAIGFAAAILIYMFIFLYGVQIMRGVIEEKTNRIVEVIISSVHPFKLMLGKIFGIAMVGLTQFFLWMILVAVLSPVAGQLIMQLFGASPTEVAQAAAQAKGMNASVAGSGNGEIGGFLSALGDLNFPLLIGMFLFYFIGGYLLYGALFAAIGSAVDSETDTQQFMFPITLPLIFSFVMAQPIVVSAPNSSMSIWLSMIPFTSPIVMMVRLPFGVPAWQIILSALLLIAGFIFTVWFASRVYRIGILMYGKKPTYKDIFKWFKMGAN